MKIIKKLAVLILCSGLIFGASSCIVLTKHDNGRHNGLHKSARKSHHPKKSAHPGHPGHPGKGHHKSKGKHKKGPR